MVQERPAGEIGPSLTGMRRLVLVVILSLGSCAAADPIDSASTCSGLADAMSEELDTVSGAGQQEAVAEIYAAAAARAGQILRESPNTPDSDSCQRIMRAVRDQETDKLYGE